MVGGTLVEEGEGSQQFLLVVDMRLSVGELQTRLDELLHGEEALFVGIDALL